MTCQIFVAITFVIGILAMLHVAIHGRDKKEPTGFRGVILTIVWYAFFIWLYWQAGTFSTILPSNE